METSERDSHLKRKLKLQLELIVNKTLFSKGTINKDTYLGVEQELLREIELVR